MTNPFNDIEEMYRREMAKETFFKIIEAKYGDKWKEKYDELLVSLRQQFEDYGIELNVSTLEAMIKAIRIYASYEKEAVGTGHMYAVSLAAMIEELKK